MLLYYQVKSGWDPVTCSRREVALPDLSAEQKRRPVYFLTSDMEASSRLAKMDAQAARLAEKVSRLNDLTTKLPELKAEYDAVLSDARADYFKQLLGKAPLAQVKK